MARRNDHSRDEIREMALAAAEEIVASQGMEGLSARRVAQTIGYTVGTLYHVFANLDDLIVQLNGRTLDQLHRHMLEGISPEASAYTTLQTLGDRYLRFASEETHRWEMVFKHRLPEERKAPAWLREKVSRTFALVETQLKALAPHRQTREITLAARALWGGVHGICILALTGNLGIAGVDSVAYLTHSLMDNYLAGFMASQPSGPADTRHTTGETDMEDADE